MLHAYVLPALGKVPLLQLEPKDVLRMMNNMEARGLSRRTQALARTVLRRCLRDAERFGKVHRNVAALTDAPKRAAVKIDDALDAAQVAKVLATARKVDADTGEPDRLAALAVVVLTVGLRQGEARGLRWSNVDLNHGRLTVTRETTKNDGGVRTIALPAFVVAALKAHKAQQHRERMAATVWADPDLVFASRVGTKLDSRNVLRWWHALTERAGVGRRRFHAARHTAATLMLNNGVMLEVVSATIGDTWAVTADVYAKVLPKMQQQAADAMQQLLGD
jgi:integrase